MVQYQQSLASTIKAHSKYWLLCKGLLGPKAFMTVTDYIAIIKPPMYHFDFIWDYSIQCDTLVQYTLSGKFTCSQRHFRQKLPIWVIRGTHRNACIDFSHTIYRLLSSVPWNCTILNSSPKKNEKEMQMKISKDNVLSPEIHTSFIHSFVHISVWKRKDVTYNIRLKWINWQSELSFDSVLINLV